MIMSKLFMFTTLITLVNKNAELFHVVREL